MQQDSNSKNNTDSDFDIVISDGIIKITLYNKVDGNTIINIRNKFLKDPNFVSGMPALYDLRKCSASLITTNDLILIKDHGEKIKQARGKHRTAILSESDLEFGISRMYEVLGERSDLVLKVFRDHDEALKWLNS